ncbi:hypothetical protein [Mongoliitalea daihaiensis]|uniref:hypothetical protein n=1 Tax=Mongoliitalea daihaiensis TaxID=2782006 RepID=UPI001F347506|nr:hypothetical protein [Mongoliitalea daihaiensis]
MLHVVLCLGENLFDNLKVILERYQKVTMQENTLTPTFPMPMRGLLLLTGMYSFAWSAFFRYFGEDLLRWLSMEATAPDGLSARVFGTVGMLVGFVIFLSAFYPISWRYLILAGIVGKLVMISWFILAFIPALDWNKRTIFHVVFSELLWLIPLTVILLRSLKVAKYIASLPEE